MVLLSLEARKIGDACDLNGIALASAMRLFKTVEEGIFCSSIGEKFMAESRAEQLYAHMK